jgi:hypothetical protein
MQKTIVSFATSVTIFLLFALARPVRAQPFAPSPTPKPPTVSLRIYIETDSRSGEVTARINEHRFTSVAALKDYLAGLPEGAWVKYYHPIDASKHPEWDKFIGSFKELAQFCATRKIAFRVSAPYW